MRKWFYLTLVVAMALTVGLYMLLAGAGVDGTRYIAGVSFLIAIAVAGQLFLPAKGRLMLWAVLAVSAASLFLRG